MSIMRPAWSWQFAPDAIQSLDLLLPEESITSDWAWEGSTGKGVRVAVIDSGIEAEHPAIGGRVSRFVTVREAGDEIIVDESSAGDAYGHGTACAGIIRSIAPDCDLISVKVLGTALSGSGRGFLGGLRWAIEQGADVCNLSLGTTRPEFYARLHELVDQAYFRRTMIVAAVNNLPVPSFPSVFATVFSVAAHAGTDPSNFFYNPDPPAEFGAPGIDVRVPWLGGEWIAATGNSFAAPHIAGHIARILGKHSNLTPFQMKMILRALAANASRVPRDGCHVESHSDDA
jgi:subtilisin